MSTIIRHKPYVESSRVPKPLASASQSSSSSSSQSSSSSSSQSSSVSQTTLDIFSTALIPSIPSGDPAKRLEEAQIKVKAAHAQRETDLVNTEELRQGGMNKSFLDLCLRDTDKRFKKAMDAIRNEYSDIGFEPGTEITQS